MAFEPDILVTSADGPEVLLVAETKWHDEDVSNAESQLKAYMAGMGSPIGLLVTPTRLRIYRDRYVTPPEKSIELIGEFDVRQLFGSHSEQTGRNAAFSFENDVQDWLESLAWETARDELSPELRQAAEANIRPAISQGIIRAAHPRSVLSA
jgi:hypothetical protein